MSQPIRGQGGHLVSLVGPKNTNLVEDVEFLLSVQRFQMRSCKCEKLNMDGGRKDEGQCMITIVHLSLRLRCTENLCSYGFSDHGFRITFS